MEGCLALAQSVDLKRLLPLADLKLTDAENARLKEVQEASGTGFTRRFLSFTTMLRPTASSTGLPRWGSSLPRTSSKGSFSVLGRRSRSVHAAPGTAPAQDTPLPESPKVELSPQSTFGRADGAARPVSRLRSVTMQGDALPTIPPCAPSSRFGHIQTPFGHHEVQQPHVEKGFLEGQQNRPVLVRVGSSGGPSDHGSGSQEAGVRGVSRSAFHGQTPLSWLPTVHSIGSSGMETMASSSLLLAEGPLSSMQGLSSLSRHASQGSGTESSGPSFGIPEGGPHGLRQSRAGHHPSRFAHGSP